MCSVNSAMPPVYFLAVLVIAVGSACFVAEGEGTAEDIRVLCPDAVDSCTEVCKYNLEYGATNCSRRGDNYTILLQPGFCTHMLNESVIIGACPYASSKWHIDESMYYVFKYNELLTMCEDLNRDSSTTLCSRCKEGYGVAIYSSSWYCSRCTLGGYAWLLYIALETVPVTVFFLAVVFFNVRATSPPMTGFILFNQILVNILRNQFVLAPLLDMYPQATVFMNIGRTLSGFWNLDFFRDIIPHFCVSHGLSNAGVIGVRGIVILYPFLLVMMSVACVKMYNRGFRPIVCFWKPVHQYFARHRRAFNANASLVDAVATFLLLSYFKFAAIFFYFYRLVEVRTLCGNSFLFTTLYIMPVTYHTPLHLLLIGLIAVVALLIPPILLIMFPTKLFRKYLAFMRLTGWQPLHMFVEKFQGDYKDGTHGTYDYRFLSGVYLFFRIVFVLPIDTTYIVRDLDIMLCLVLFLFVALFLALVRPYKKNHMNIIESLIYTLCCLICWCYYYFKFISGPHHKALLFALTCILASIPMCAFILYSGYRCINARRSEQLASLMRRCSTRVRGSGEVNEALIESFADRIQNPRTYGSLGEEQVSNSTQETNESSGDYVYK